MTKKRTAKKKVSKSKFSSSTPVILNDRFEFIEVGESNVLISPKATEFYALDRGSWEFLKLFEYGASFDYVIKSVKTFVGEKKVYEKEYLALFEKLYSATAIKSSKKFINPIIDDGYATKKPSCKKYDKKWIEANHPELLISVDFCDTWNPSA